MSDKYQHHKYTWTKRFGFVNHNWELVGPEGAIHFHVSINTKPESGLTYPPSAGLEYHHRQPPYADTAPSQLACPLTGGWCWHEGTSLYASESVWPHVEHYLRVGDHESIFHVLEYEYGRHFDELDGSEGES